MEKRDCTIKDWTTGQHIKCITQIKVFHFFFSCFRVTKAKADQAAALARAAALKEKHTLQLEEIKLKSKIVPNGKLVLHSGQTK